MQAVVSFYWVMEETLQLLMNSRIQDEEEWQMSRRYWRGLFHLISDRNYYKRMNGDEGGGGGGSSSGRTGTKGSENGVVIDKFGNVLYKNINNKGENYVYMLDEKDNSLKNLGKLGDKVDISEILQNLLVKNAEIANDLNPYEFADKVRDFGEWDLKANTNTIFGLAWSERYEIGFTGFYTTNFSYMSASDVGNYHYGYVGRAAGFDYFSLWIGAGIAESVKNLINGDFGIAYDLFNKSHVGILPTIPFNDRVIDFIWTTRGMRYYDKRK